MDDIRKEMRLKYEDEHKSRLWDKIKEDPFVPIGKTDLIFILYIYICSV